ncbi:MAG: KdsC family phosphatase [Planctomycetota bacterium]|jgi:3-deoxy-D-manno-octulosonate 8-phosphate phosphatase (KDO 8-P phosphatase)
MNDSLIVNIKLLLMDVDGVLTNGDVIYGSGQMEIKIFNIQDGMGITLAKAAGLQVGVITGRKCEAVQRRCSELGFDIILQNCPDKIEGYQAIKQKFGYADDEIAYIGDDVQDLPVLRCVGVPLGVGNSVDEVKKLCIFVATRHGGKGAVREIIDRLLNCQNRKIHAIKKVLEQTRNTNAINLQQF